MFVTTHKVRYVGSHTSVWLGGVTFTLMRLVLFNGLFKSIDKSTKLLIS